MLPTPLPTPYTPLLGAPGELCQLYPELLMPARFSNSSGNSKPGPDPRLPKLWAEQHLPLRKAFLPRCWQLTSSTAGFGHDHPAVWLWPCSQLAPIKELFWGNGRQTPLLLFALQMPQTFSQVQDQRDPPPGCDPRLGSLPPTLLPQIHTPPFPKRVEIHQRSILLNDVSPTTGKKSPWEISDDFYLRACYQHQMSAAAVT